MENDSQILDNNNDSLENNTVDDELSTGKEEQKPIIIEKKPRKKRESNSVSQLETLKKGREKLREKQLKQREEKKCIKKKSKESEYEMKFKEREENFNELYPNITQTLEKLQSNPASIEKPASEHHPAAPTSTHQNKPKIFVLNLKSRITWLKFNVLKFFKNSAPNLCA